MDAILELLTTQVETLSERIDAFRSQPIHNDYNWQQGSYNPNYYQPDLQNHLTFSWCNNDQDQFYAPNLSYPPLQSQEPKSNLEKLLIEATERMEMRIMDQAVFTPELSHSPEFLFQSPPNYNQAQLYDPCWHHQEFSYQQAPLQQEENSNEEDLLMRILEQSEMRMNNQDASLRNLENHLEQLANAINNGSTLPSDTEINSKWEGEEQCVGDTIGYGEESYVTVEGNLERSHPNMEEDCEVENVWSKTGEYEKETGKDDHAENSISDMQNPIVPLVPFPPPFLISEEYSRVEFIEDNNKEEFPSNFKDCFHVEVVKGTVNDAADEKSYFVPIDKDEFGGGPQFCIDVDELKEKTTRRHAMTIFAYEPD